VDCTLSSTGSNNHTSRMNETQKSHVHPEYNPAIPVITRANGAIQFGDHSVNVTSTPQTLQWFTALDGSLRFDAALQSGTEMLGLESRHVRALLDHGFTSGALLDAHRKPRTVRWLNSKSRNRTNIDLACAQKYGPYEYGAYEYGADRKSGYSSADPAEILDRRNTTQLELVGEGPVALAIYELGTDAGFQFTTERSRASLVVFVSTSHPFVFEHVNSHMCSIPHLHVGARMDAVTIGPFVIPGISSCFRCAQLHRRDTLIDWMDVDLQWRRHNHNAQTDSLVALHAGAHTLLLIRHWIDGVRITDSTWSAQLPWLRFQQVSAPAHPLCGCQDPSLHTTG